MNSIHIDFQIYDSNDPKQIIVLDTSIWANIVDKPSIIKIRTPGSKNFVGYNFDKNGVTILNSVNLGLTCYGCKEEFADLPDGVYEIQVVGSPSNFNKTRFYLKTTTLQNQLDDILLKEYSDCDNCDDNSETISKIIRYKNLISVAEAFVRKGHTCEAQDIIFKIQGFLKKFKNCRKCPHKV